MASAATTPPSSPRNSPGKEHIGDRLFEVITPITPDEGEWIRRLLVREVQLPERILYLCLRPEDHDGASNIEYVPELVKVTPHAYITDKPVETLDESGQVVHLKQIDVREVARRFFSEANLARLGYCLIVPSDVNVNAELAQSGEFPRYRFNGSPVLDSYVGA